MEKKWKIEKAEKPKNVRSIIGSSRITKLGDYINGGYPKNGSFRSWKPGLYSNRIEQKIGR